MGQTPRRVMLATPAHDWRADVRFFDSVLRTVKLCAEHGIEIIPVFLPGDALVQKARNDLVRMAIEASVDDIFFIDSDQFWEPEWVLRLLQYPVDVVGAPVRKKADDKEVYNVKANGPFIPVDEATGLWLPLAVGTGFLRLSRDALEAAWLASDEYTNPDGSAGRMVFDVRVLEGKLYGEDTILCGKLADAGFPIYLDPTFTVPHVGMKVYEGDFVAYIEGLQKTETVVAANGDNWGEINRTSTPINEGSAFPQPRKILMDIPDEPITTVDTIPPIFIGGAGRSGTTLLRVMLDSHPNIACGPELTTFPGVCMQAAQTLGDHPHDPAAIGDGFKAILDQMMEPYWLESGKPRVAVKTPHNALVFAMLHLLYPEAPLIHIIRDGRDVVASLLAMKDWEDPHTGKTIDYTSTAAGAASYWVQVVTTAREVASAVRGQYYEVRYEDLTTNPSSVLVKLSHFIGEPFNEAMLDYHKIPRDLSAEANAEQVSKPVYSDAIGRWKQDLSPQDLGTVMGIAGPLLAELGYIEADAESA